jgi:hypothetical protein
VRCFFFSDPRHTFRDCRISHPHRMTPEPVDERLGLARQYREFVDEPRS